MYAPNVVEYNHALCFHAGQYTPDSKFVLERRLIKGEGAGAGDEDTQTRREE